MKAIEIKNCQFIYPNGHCAISDLNLSLNQGEQLAIIGQNGAGKTTGVKLLTGLIRPSIGDVHLFNESIKDKTVAQIAHHVGYVFQNPDDQIFNSTIEKEIEFGLKILKLSDDERAERIKKYAKLVHLETQLNEHPYNISYAQRKFITLASILAMEPSIIILDEPTAGQDELGLSIIGEVIDYLKTMKCTVIVIAHDMEFVANHFERVAVMADSKLIFDGQTKDVFLNDDILKQADVKKPIVLSVLEAINYEDSLLTLKELKTYLNK